MKSVERDLERQGIKPSKSEMTSGVEVVNGRVRECSIPNASWYRRLGSRKKLR